MAKTPQQIALLGGAAGLTAGLLIGFFAGREHLKAELRQGIINAFSGGDSSVASKAPKSTTKPQESSDYSAIVSEKNEMSDTTKYTLTVLTDKKLNGGYGLAEYGSIVVRCESGDIDLYINAAAFLSSDGQNIKLRWDDGSPSTEWWTGSSSGTALFSGAPRSFLARASNAKKLVAQYSPWRQADEIAVYQFSDSNRSDFQKMQDYCK